MRQIKNAKPGLLTEGLRTALGMADGSPPPWLINMQRYGPPPSYGDLKVKPQAPPFTAAAKPCAKYAGGFAGC